MSESANNDLFGASEAGQRSPTGTPYRQLFRLGAPVILLNLTFVAMQTTDAWMLGQLGKTELAAVTKPSMVIFLIVSFGYGLLASITTTASNCFGRQQWNRCAEITWLGAVLALVVGVSSFALWPLAPFFRIVPGASESLSSLETEYFRVTLLALTPVLLTSTIANFFFAIQRTAIVLFAACAAMVMNVVINYALIFGQLGFPAMGFSGAAWGTVIASTLEFLGIAAFFLWLPDQKYGCRRPPRTLAGIGKLVKIGLPAGGQAAVDVLSWGVLLTILITTCGDDHLAAASVLLRCMQVTFLPAEGLATVLVTLVGASRGRRRPTHARVYTRIAFRCIAGYMFGFGLLFYIFRYPIMRSFSDSPEVVAIGVVGMAFVTLAQWFDAMNITYLHALQGAGDTRWPWLVNLALSVGILLVGGISVRLFLPHQGSAPIWGLVLIYIAGQGIAFRLRWRCRVWESMDIDA